MMNFNLILGFLTGVICATLFQQFNNGMINNGGSAWGSGCFSTKQYLQKAEEGEDQTTPHNYVEELMYLYKLDKSRDDHLYVKYYTI